MEKTQSRTYKIGRIAFPIFAMLVGFAATLSVTEYPVSIDYYLKNTTVLFLLAFRSMATYSVLFAILFGIVFELSGIGRNLERTNT